MALKIYNNLFTGPFKVDEYIYKKNKRDTIIIFVEKMGKDYAPEFYCNKVILGTKKDINFKDYLKDNTTNTLNINTYIYIREYAERNSDEMKKTFNKINNNLMKEKLIRMEY